MKIVKNTIIVTDVPRPLPREGTDSVGDVMWYHLKQVIKSPSWCEKTQKMKKHPGVGWWPRKGECGGDRVGGGRKVWRGRKVWEGKEGVEGEGGFGEG